MNDYDKINLYCNTFQKYMKCMKEIEPPCLSSVLKDIESKICSIINEKENECIEKQKSIIEPKQHNITVKSKKSKQGDMKRHKMKNV